MEFRGFVQNAVHLMIDGLAPFPHFLCLLYSERWLPATQAFSSKQWVKRNCMPHPRVNNLHSIPEFREIDHHFNQFLESCFVRKLCSIYFPKHAFCGRFSSIVTESDVRNVGVVDLAQKERLHTHDGHCSIMRNLSTNYCKSDLRKYTFFMINYNIGMDWWGYLGHSLVYSYLKRLV